MAGKIYLANGQVDIAVKHYHRAIQDDRDNSVSYAGLGEALTFQNRLDEALRYTLLAIEGQPMNEKLHNNAGFTLIRQGKFDEAIPRLQEALRLAPDYAKAHSNLGGALLLTGTHRIDEAIHHLREAVRLEPGNQSARENLNYALAQKTEVKRAEDRNSKNRVQGPGSRYRQEKRKKGIGGKHSPMPFVLCLLSFSRDPGPLTLYPGPFLT